MVVEVDVKTLLTNDWIVIRAIEEGKIIRESKVTDQMKNAKFRQWKVVALI